MMNVLKIIGALLMVAGLAGLFTGGFSFTQEKTAAQLGPLQFKVEERRDVDIPHWLSLGVLAVGGVLLIAGFRKP